MYFGMFSHWLTSSENSHLPSLHPFIYMGLSYPCFVVWSCTTVQREMNERTLYWDVANQILSLRNLQFRPRDCIQSALSLFFFLIWLHWVLVGTCRNFTAACWIFSCSSWDPVPWPGIEPGPLHWECSLSHWITREVLALFSWMK